MVNYKDLGLVNTREMFARAIKGGYAIPAFNFNNMEQMQAIIKAAVETLFNVKVEAVRTLNFQGKVRRTARGFGKRSDWKKAYVTLPEGTQLDIEDASQQTNKESK